MLCILNQIDPAPKPEIIMKNLKTVFLFVTVLGTCASLRAVIPVERVNSETIGLYEKFEAVYDLEAFEYDNPFDPDQIDVTAIFTSPSGKHRTIFGFYDNYQNADAWKVRFSPDETGEWSVVISARDVNGEDHSNVLRFTAVESGHHGRLRVSAENPRYLRYDDGTGFYGVGMYTPWRNDVEKFDRLEKYGGNIFAIWNIMYGGMVNGYGIIEEELGRYNQQKCGKIDTLLTVAEDRNLICMYCFWPHDLFSATVWAHQWHHNPYNTICDVEDVYADELCWEYQKKQYRYLIARFSHSRALGIWEIMNEINGTDGWAAGRHDEAKQWVKKVHDYFKANDPYRHLTTASRSGGYNEYWPELYHEIDMPNLHVYETQGWPTVYPGNTLRSSMYNYAWAARRFWKNFEKPGIFGEAGADWVHVDIHTPEYTALYHNAIWACLTNGLSMTPIWWTFTNPITDAEREHMSHLGLFVKDYNFIRDSKQPFEKSTKEYDLYGMVGDSAAIVWLRQVSGYDVSDLQFELEDVLVPDEMVYAVSYFNTWAGEELDTHIRPHLDSKLRDTVPLLESGQPDVAFKIRPAKGGDTPARLQLSVDRRRIFNVDTMRVTLSCYLFDERDRFCPNAAETVTFALQGKGELEGPVQTAAQNGAAHIVYRPPSEPGQAVITVSSPGLLADTLSLQVKDREVVDDFESYPSQTDLANAWVTRSSSKADVSLVEWSPGGGEKAMQMDYIIGPDYRYTAVIEKAIDRSFAGGNFLGFWLQPDGSGRELEIRLYNQDGRYWYYTFELAGTGPDFIVVPLDEFVTRSKNVELDLSQPAALRLVVKKGDSEFGDGSLRFDDFRFSADAPSDIRTGQAAPPAVYALEQNFPNPFNPSTTIRYRVAQSSGVTIDVYNLKGQRVDVLVNKVQNAGRYEIEWRPAAVLSSGIYFLRMAATGFADRKKCLLVR